jgi:hypothetical protein
VPKPFQRFRDWLNATDLMPPEELTAELVTIGGSGDVAQVSDLPAEVAQAYGINTQLERITRAQAITLPPVAAARDCIAATIGTFPLVATRGTAEVARKLLEQPDPRTTRQWVITWLVDDLIFGPVAWWWVDTTDAQGFPETVHRIAPERITVQRGGVVVLDGTPLTAEQANHLIRFDGPDEGLLARGVVALRTGLMLEQAARKYAKGETPADVLRDTRPAGVGADLTTDEITTLLTNWRKARSLEGTAYLPRSLEHHVPNRTTAKELQLLEARQNTAVEVARLTKLDAAAVNAPLATGMTYANQGEVRRARLSTAYRPYLEAIAARLSMPDVTPRGHVVTFKTADWLLGDATERVTTAVAASGGPVMTTTEARAMFLALPESPELGTTPTATNPPATDTGSNDAAP